MRAFFFGLVLAGALGLAGVFALTPGQAHEVRHGDIVIEHAKVRPTIGPVRRSAGYFTLRNTGGAADRITGAQIDGAGRVEIHTSFVEEGVMQMREAADGVPVPEGGVAVFKPRGLHLMVMELAGPLKEGTEVEGALVLEKAGRLPVTFHVEPPDLSGGEKDASHTDH